MRRCWRAGKRLQPAALLAADLGLEGDPGALGVGAEPAAEQLARGGRCSCSDGLLSRSLVVLGLGDEGWGGCSEHVLLQRGREAVALVGRREVGCETTSDVIGRKSRTGMAASRRATGNETRLRRWDRRGAERAQRRSTLRRGEGGG